MKSLIAVAVVAGACFMTGGQAFAQGSVDENIELLRKDVRSQKKQIIAGNLDLTDEQAQQFWPIYDRYTAEVKGIYDAKFALLKEYARIYATMSDKQAEGYIQGRAGIEESMMQLRLKYFTEFRKVLPAKTTALFFQMDWRLTQIVDLQLDSQIPLIEP